MLRMQVHLSLRSNPYDGKGTVATKGTKDEKRMREICNGNGRGTQDIRSRSPSRRANCGCFFREIGASLRSCSG